MANRTEQRHHASIHDRCRAAGRAALQQFEKVAKPSRCAHEDALRFRERREGPGAPGTVCFVSGMIRMELRRPFLEALAQLAGIK